MTRPAPKKKTDQERRGSVRADRVVAIRHRLHQAAVKKSEDHWGLSTTKNMSLTGLLFWSESPYKIGDIVEVSVTMSALIDIFQGFAEVVRVVERSASSYDIAVRFVQMKTASRRAKSHLGKK